MWVIILKRPEISLIIDPRASECEKKLNANAFQVLNLLFDPCLKLKFGHCSRGA